MSMTMTTNERQIRIGGLMRCCIATIQENQQPSQDGDVLDCEHCSSQMTVAEDGVWEWVNSFRAM